MIERIVAFADDFGFPMLARVLPRGRIVGLVAASIRPGQHAALEGAARAADVPMMVQPRRGDAGYAEFLERLRALRPDFFIVNSYSMKLWPEVLALAPQGGINAHGALLPQYRGANPIQWAMIRGDRETGVTIHRLAEDIDAGPIYAQRRLPIHPEDTWRDVHARTGLVTEALLAEVLPAILAGEAIATPQDPALARRFPRRGPEDGRIDPDASVQQIHDLIRALVAPLPGAFIDTPEGRRVFDRYHSLDEVAALRRELAGTARPLECREVRKSFPLLDGAGAWRVLLGVDAGGAAFEALRGVSLDVPRGKLVGILGRNGAGKSTLLRVLGGVYPPSAGSIRLSGDLGSLFELGGMGNRFITGRECADRVLRILGAPVADLQALVEEVKAFSELGDFFERRIYTYSAGMAARLYFSIATAQRHDVYLIDEVLSVGDEHFQAKCWRRLRERLLNGACGVLVTHDWSAVIKLCERSHVLDRGAIALSGKSEQVVAGYLRIPPPDGARAAFAGLPGRVDARSGEDLDWRFDIEVKHPDTPVEFAFSIETIRPGFGWEILVLSEYEPVAAAPGRYRVCLRVPRLPLAAGEYSLNLFLHAGRGETSAGEAADQRSWTVGNALKLVVEGAQEGAPVFRVPVTWRSGAARGEGAHVAH